MTKQQQVLAGVLGVAGLALVADRVFLGGGATGPQSSAAATPATPSTVPTSTTVSEASAPAAADSMETGRLAALILAAAERSGVEPETFSDQLAGGFVADASWRPITESGEPAVSEAEAQANEDSRVPPPPHLSAILRGERSGAILDDRFVVVGGRIGVYEVREVHERSVVLDGPAGAVVLRIEKPIPDDDG